MVKPQEVNILPFLFLCTFGNSLLCVSYQTFTCDKCEKVLPTATALKYHTCADVSIARRRLGE